MSKPLTVTRANHMAAALRVMAAKCRDPAQLPQLLALALALVLEGRSRTEAAEQSGMQRQTLRDWVHRYNAQGVEGLKSRKSPGAAPSLAEAQRAELKALVIKGPDPAVHKVVRWRCQDLQAEVVRRFAVELHESNIGKWLHKRHPTRLQPRQILQHRRGFLPRPWRFLLVRRCLSLRRLVPEETSTRSLRVVTSSSTNTRGRAWGRALGRYFFRRD